MTEQSSPALPREQWNSRARISIDQADCSRWDDLKVLRKGLDESNVHGDIRFQLVDRDVTFLNGGFPINLDGGGVNCIPGKYIQPTIIMMLAAALQGLNKYLSL